MGAPTTLLALANLIQSTATAEQQFFQTEAEDARSALTQTLEDLDDSTTEKAALEAEVTALRQAVANAATEAAGRAALAELWSKIAETRGKASEIVTLGRDRAVLQRRLDASSRFAAQSAGRVQQAASAVPAAQAAAATQTADDTKLGVPPLSAVATTANRRLNTAPDNAPYLAAKARIEGDIPLELRQRAQQRWAATKADASLAAELPAHLGALQRTMVTTSGSAQERLKIPQAAFEVSKLPLDQFRLNGPLSLERASQLLARVADTTFSPLTAEQAQAITDASTDGAPAATAEKARDDKRQELAAAEAALQQAIWDARAADFDVDPETVQAVIDANADVTQLEGELTAADAAYTAALEEALDAWEAAVPESTWRLYADFLDAEATLTALAAVNTATLITNRTNAEKAWVQALAAEDKRARLERFLAYERTVSEAAVQFDAESAGVRLVQALRGDI